MYCTRCGAEVVDGASYCGACGAYLHQPPPDTPDRSSPSIPMGAGAMGTSGPPTTASEADTSAAHQPSYAGFWLRAGALVLDSMILIGVAIAFAVLVALLDTDLLVERGTPRAAARELIGGLLSWLYYAGMESSSLQGTLGKRALRLRVTDLSGRRVSFGRATGRYFGKVLSAITLGAGYLMVVFTDRRQALHDIVAGCLVVTEVNRPA